MDIRVAKVSDAENLAALIQEVDATSQYMLWEAGERNILPENELKVIEKMSRIDISTIFVAEDENKLVGYLRIIGDLLLQHGLQEAAKKGFPKLYLSTDLEDYYEKYGWTNSGIVYGVSGGYIKLYEKDTDG